MKKHWVFFTLLLALPFFSFANKDSVAPSTRISLITCGQGDAIYSYFGHSAILVYDDSLGIDKVYNYGTFDFDDPNFIMKFVRGKLLYKLSLNNINRFLRQYRRFNRSVYEQVLNLTPQQKQEIYEFLENNYLPENRYYLYDFYFDNCATRIRDVFEDVLADSLKLDYSPFDTLTKSYRFLIKPDLKNEKWLTLGIDLIMGKSTDLTARPRDYSFLPRHMATTFRNAKVMKDTAWKNFVTTERTLFKAKRTKQEAPGFFDKPKPVLWVLFGIFALVFFFLHKAKKRISILDFILWLVPAALGVLLLFLMLYSDHHVVKSNLHIIWANPLHLIFIWGLLRKNPPKWVKKYFLIYGILLIVFLIFMGILPQYFPGAIIPIVLILVLSAFRIQKRV